MYMGVRAGGEVGDRFKAVGATAGALAATHTCPPKSRAVDPGTRAEGQLLRGAELIRLRRDALLRLPDWRARLASAILRYPDRQMVERMTACADDAVRELVRLDRLPPDSRHPLAEARTLFGPGRLPVRVEVEARLLAGQDPAEIDDLAGLGKGTAEWFHAAFYHCGDRLQAPGFIRHLFLGDEPQGDGRDGPPLEWARWYGYYGGAPVLEAVLDAFRNWEADRRPSRGGTAEELARRARRLYARAGLLSRSIAVENLSRAELRALLARAAGRRGAEHPGRRYTSSAGAPTGSLA